MSSYFVDFTAYVDERRRPENFPHKVNVQELFSNVESIPHLQFLVNEKFMSLVKSAGLVVMKNPDEPLEEGKVTFDKRIFVPWHMLTYMKVDVHLIAEQSVSSQDRIAPDSAASDKKAKDTVN